MGQRIRQIRLGQGLRQWELARLLGTTQSAVHKYEHGVIPEPRRLIELARVGGTSVEWVLTGRHWENGSEEQRRLGPEVLSTACLLRELSDERRDTLDEALRIFREAVRALQHENGDTPGPDNVALLATLQDHSADTLRLLESAWRIQRAVLHQLAEEAGQRLERSGNDSNGEG
jgi:transcriptional regulator with XRE-family HTH domain